MPTAAPPVQAAAPAPAHSSGKLGGNDDDSLPLAPLVALNDVHPAVVAPVAPGPAPTADDRDGDGVPDREDSCPDQRGPAKNHGCPEDTEMHVFLDGDHLTIDSRVEFRAGSSALERRSLPLLQQLALVLQNHPELTHIEVRAHTDSSLPDDRAKALSQERAETVVKFLGGQGIPAERLSAEGMGSGSPIAPNITAKGRKKNERIEIVIGK